MVYQKRGFGTVLYQTGQHWLGRLQRLVLPPRCIACGNAGGYSNRSQLELDLCAACHAQLPANLHACRCCGLPLSSAQADLICGRCLRQPPSYQACWCAYEYAYPIEHLIRRLKYGGGLATARVLSHLLAQHLLERYAGLSTQEWPECFIPVPLHATRYHSRGYNQVIELGRVLQHELNIPMRTDLVKRNRHTTEQAGLSRRERRKNLRRAFITTAVALPKHIALLDDVITTGSTINELANTLKTAGVTRIEVWGLARASLKVKKVI